MHLIHELTGPAAFTAGVRRWATEAGLLMPTDISAWPKVGAAARKGLAVWPADLFHEDIVKHMFWSKIPGGWREQRAEFIAGRKGVDWRRIEAMPTGARAKMGQLH